MLNPYTNCTLIDIDHFVKLLVVLCNAHHVAHLVKILYTYNVYSVSHV